MFIINETLLLLYFNPNYLEDLTRKANSVQQVES